MAIAPAHRVDHQHPVIHATALAYGPDAVLLRGPSGIGKSDLALRAIALGAVASLGIVGPRLIADDAVRIDVIGSDLWVTAPETIFGKLEVRGLGIIELPNASIVPRDTWTRARLVIDLTRDDVERMPEAMRRPVTGIRPPALDTPTFDLPAFDLPAFDLNVAEPSAAVKLGLVVNAVRTRTRVEDGG